jgi:hypothetical protein
MADPMQRAAERITIDYPVTILQQPTTDRLVKGVPGRRSTKDVPRHDSPPSQDDVQAAAGMDTHPGGEQLKHYWVYGEGAAKWSTWTELRDHLLKYLNPEMAKRTAAEWFHLRYGDWPGSDTNKVRHGKPPRGEKVGPG